MNYQNQQKRGTEELMKTEYQNTTINQVIGRNLNIQEKKTNRRTNKELSYLILEDHGQNHNTINKT